MSISVQPIGIELENINSFQENQQELVRVFSEAGLQQMFKQKM
jgi:hypothetical protein